MEVSGQFRSPVALLSRKKPLYPLDRRLVGFQSWSGAVEKRKYLLPTGNGIPAALLYTD
jgi:hypothetical protein